MGPGFNNEFGDTYGIVYRFTADGFTHRGLRDYVDEARKQLLEVPDISKIDVLGAQDERVYVEFSTELLAALGIYRPALIAALDAQNAVTPQGVVQTGDEKILVRVSGAFQSERDIAVNFVANARIIRLGGIAHVTRGPADPAQPIFHVKGKEGIGLAIACPRPRAQQSTSVAPYPSICAYRTMSWLGYAAAADEPFCLGKPVSVAGAWRLALQPNHPSPHDGFSGRINSSSSK